jgi:hypothetical protein
VTGLEDAGLIVRDLPVAGRIKTTELTATGQARLTAAAKHVQELEDVLVTNAGGDISVILGWLNASADELSTRMAD